GEGNTGLIVAISRSDERWTGYLLNNHADPNLGGKGGDTPLIAAARVGFAQAIEWLLALGAKVDAANRMGETPLIIAVQQRELPGGTASEAQQFGLAPRRRQRAVGCLADDRGVIPVSDDQPGLAREVALLLQDPRQVRRHRPVEAVAIIQIVKPLAVADEV